MSIRKAFLAAGNGPLLIATDGSSIGKSPTPTTAGWGMACCIKDNRDPKDQKVAGGPLQGMVTSPSAAEMQALLHVLRALREAPRPATTMVDNLNCVKGVAAGRYTGYCHVLWREIFNHMAHIPDVEVIWIPSHGKKKGEWKPPPGHDEEIWRQLNHLADLEASSAAERVREELRPEAEAVQAHRNWSQLAIAKMFAVQTWHRELHDAVGQGA